MVRRLISKIKAVISRLKSRLTQIKTSQNKTVTSQKQTQQTQQTTQQTSQKTPQQSKNIVSATKTVAKGFTAVGKNIKEGAKTVGKGIAKGVATVGKGVAKGVTTVGKGIASFYKSAKEGTLREDVRTLKQGMGIYAKSLEEAYVEGSKKRGPLGGVIALGKEIITSQKLQGKLEAYRATQGYLSTLQAKSQFIELHKKSLESSISEYQKRLERFEAKKQNVKSYFDLMQLQKEASELERMHSNIQKGISQYNISVAEFNKQISNVEQAKIESHFFKPQTIGGKIALFAMQATTYPLLRPIEYYGAMREKGLTLKQKGVETLKFGGELLLMEAIGFGVGKASQKLQTLRSKWYPVESRIDLKSIKGGEVILTPKLTQTQVKDLLAGKSIAIPSRSAFKLEYSIIETQKKLPLMKAGDIEIRMPFVSQYSKMQRKITVTGFPKDVYGGSGYGGTGYTILKPYMVVGKKVYFEIAGLSPLKGRVFEIIKGKPVKIGTVRALPIYKGIGEMDKFTRMVYKGISPQYLTIRPNQKVIGYEPGLIEFKGKSVILPRSQLEKSFEGREIIGSTIIKPRDYYYFTIKPKLQAKTYSFTQSEVDILKKVTGETKVYETLNLYSLGARKSFEKIETEIIKTLAKPPKLKPSKIEPFFEITKDYSGSMKPIKYPPEISTEKFVSKMQTPSVNLKQLTKNINELVKNIKISEATIVMPPKVSQQQIKKLTAPIPISPKKQSQIQKIVTKQELKINIKQPDVKLANIQGQILSQKQQQLLMGKIVGYSKKTGQKYKEKQKLKHPLLETLVPPAVSIPTFKLPKFTMPMPPHPFQTPFIPFIDLPKIRPELPKGIQFKELKPQKFKYQPSFPALVLNIKAPKIPKTTFTGLTLRPIISGRKSVKKRK